MASSFRDSKGVIWLLRFSLGAARRIRQQAGIDVFAEDFAQKVFGQIDVEVLAAILLALTEAQRETLGISADEFLDRLDGEVLARAWQAMTEAWIDFFPLVPADLKQQMKDQIRTESERAIEEARRQYEARATSGGKSRGSRR